MTRKYCYGFGFLPMLKADFQSLGCGCSSSRGCPPVYHLSFASNVNITYLQVLLEFSLTPRNCMLKIVFNIGLYYSTLFSQILLV